MRPAFTLIELLVVIAIIGVLIGLLLPVAGEIRFRARGTDTVQRLRNIEAALRTAGSGGEGAAMTLHREVIAPALQAQGIATGITAFQASVGRQVNWDWQSGGGNLVPVAGTWIDPSQPFLWPFPWGQPTLGPDGAKTGVLLERRLDQLDPTATPGFLRFLGLITDDAQWLDDRSGTRGWNDAWGNPVVIGFALYQPLLNTSTQTQWRQAGNHLVTRTGVLPDLYLKQAMTTYGFNRAVYLSLGAVGPELRGTLAGNAVQASRDLWTQVSDVCEATSWDQDAWNARPEAWKGDVRWGRRNGERCFLTAPIELR
jgi:prepilin-type N-terminal cleavage/methylation domain-containing protein